MATPTRTDPLGELWATSQGALREQISVLADAAIGALEGELDAARRARAAREAHRLASSLGTFGLTAAGRQASDVEWLLQGVGTLESADAHRLSELVVAIQAEFAGGPRFTVDSAGAGEVAAILILEPDAGAGRRLVEQATAAGLRPTLVESVAEARGQLAVSTPDLAIVDPADPRDPDAGRALVGDLCLGPSPVPTLVVTAAGGPVDRAETARLKASGFLEKPAQPGVVVDVVRATLERGRAEFTVFVMTDQPPLSDELRTALQPFGGHVSGADDPAHFWSRLELTSPDLLVLSPAPIDGPQLCRMVRNDPAWDGLPVVCLTTSDLMRELYRSGADDVLVRPVDPLDLVERITNRLERTRLRRRSDGDDPQTGLPTWHRVEADLQRQLVMARRYGQPLAIAVFAVDGVDMDRQHGQHASRAARSALGRLLARSFRIEDAVGGRGEHLVTGLYGAEPAGAMARISSVLSSFRGMQVTLGEHQFRATASAGIAMFPVDGNRLDELYESAVTAATAAAVAGGDRLQTSSTTGTQQEGTVDVLVVDDDDALAPLLLHALTTQGYRVHRLRDGADATSQLLAPDGLRARVVLLDVDLPGLDGFATLRELAGHGVLEKTRIIMVTRRSGEAEVLEALELGAFDHIGKPLSIPVLLHRVRRALESLWSR